ncbi:MAG: ABC transporter permease [Acidobacteriota bacterium]
MQSAAIAVKNLTIKYGKFTAVNKVTFIVPKGEIFAFLGPNGSGKTTLIKTLCGIIKPSSGKGYILGLDIIKDSETIKEHIGYMPQQFSLYKDLTVSENMDFYGNIYGLGPEYLQQRKEELIMFLGLQDYVDRRTRELSGGLKQRLALACTIIHKPEVVFLDEPTAGIDPVARRQLWDLLFRLAGQEQITFFVTTHYMDEAERCGRVSYIYFSKLIACGTPDELKVMPTITPPGTVRLEITCKSISSALMFVKDLPYIFEATIFGQSMHVLMDASKRVERLAADLVNAGFGNPFIQYIKPSLEDVFVSLTNNSAEKEGKQRVETTADVDDDIQTKSSPQRRNYRMRSIYSSMLPILRKEFIHISRDMRTMALVLFFLIIRLVLIGLAIETNVRQIRTVVYDLSRTQESRELIQRFVNTDTFNIVNMVYSDEQLQEAIVSGRARVGIKIPANYARHSLEGSRADVLVLVDGSNSTVTTVAISVSDTVMLRESLNNILDNAPSIRAANRFQALHKVLFNPDTRTANFIIPSAIALELGFTFMYGIVTAIVGEREKGTLDQLYLTPINPVGLMLGKLLPYCILGLVMQMEAFLLAFFVFGVPMRGNFLLLLLFTIPFLLLNLGIGLVFSTKARTVPEALQLISILQLPSVFLSGYIFEVDSMPVVFQWISRIFPLTYYIEIVRGIILRGAEFHHLWLNALIMLVGGLLMILIAARQFQKSSS